MIKSINSTVLSIFIVSLFLAGCFGSNQKSKPQNSDQEVVNDISYDQFITEKIDTVRYQMRSFFQSIQPNDSLENVRRIRTMHYGTGHEFMSIDTTAVPADDSLLWTTASSLKRFYLESQHLLANEVLFVMDSLPLSMEQRRSWTTKLKQHEKKEKQYYTLFTEHAKNQDDSFTSVYRPLYHLLGLTE